MKIMKLVLVFCLIINLVVASKEISYDSESESAESSIREGSDNTYSSYDTEGVLDFRGRIRQLFAVEMMLQHPELSMLFCSPISAMIPLAKLVFGAKSKSKTEQELLTALGLNNRRELTREYKQTFKELRFLKGVEISIASRLYASDKHKLQSKFKHRTKKIFESAIESIDTTRKEEVANKVNNWVAEHTKNRIGNIISANSINPSTSLLLVNAIYFKGSWRTPFKPATLQPFYAPGGMRNIPMMNVTGRFNYMHSTDLNAKIVELPYVGEEASMIIVLPNDRNGLPILLRALKVSYKLLRDALLRMEMTKVTVTMPKFKKEATINLKHYFKNMGLDHCLEAESSGLTEIVKHQKLYISSAVQKAAIEVTEEGTAAAAATATQIIPTSFTVPKEFTANHPFLFYVSAKREQLFAGIFRSFRGV